MANRKPLCPDPNLLSPEELAMLLRLLPQLENWINAVKDEAMRLARDNALPGYKVVAGRSLRRWIDESKAENVLSTIFDEDALYSRKFVSVAQAESLVGKAAFRKVAEQLVTRTEGKPVLAPLSDRRPAIHAAAEFEPIAKES